MSANLRTFLLSLLILLIVSAVNVSFNVASVKASQKVKSYINNTSHVRAILKKKSDRVIQESLIKVKAKRNVSQQ